MPTADVLFAGDEGWWDVYGAEAKRHDALELWTHSPEAARAHRVNYVEAAKEPGLSGSKTRIHAGRNSGHAAIGLAALWGATKIVLLGFDFQRTGGASHWHGNHEGGLANPPAMTRWIDDMVLLGSDLRRAGVRVVNATRETAIRCFVRASLAEALGATAPRIMVEGMHGLGDNLHQRAIVRELMRDREVWLETPWPQVYHDLVGDRLHLVSKGSTLRTQAKNAAKHAGAFERSRAPIDNTLRIHYPPASVREHGSVLAGMCATVGLPVGDFRLPVPKAWHAKAEAWLARWKPTRPLMLYRPLNERVEWSGCRNRNPDYDAYAALYEAIAPEFFVVSVADFVPGKEWQVGKRVRADVECHAGELDFETLAALTMRAAMVFASPGFLCVLAQAVSTPLVNVVGGYEDGTSFAAGARYAPYLPIQPIKPCPCFSHTHACDKRIDMPKAYGAVVDFAARVLPEPLPARTDPIDLKGLPIEYSNAGEIEALIELARSVNAANALEIGCNTGRTSAALLRHVGTLRYMVGVDVLPGYVTDMPAQRREVPTKPGHLAAGDPRFELVLRKRGAFDLTPSDLGKFDFIFIDGDHGRAGVENDTKLALACAVPGSIIVWHDYNLTGVVDVREVLNEYRAQGRNVRLIAGTWLAYEVVSGDDEAAL